MLTNQTLVYKVRQVILTIVIPRTENVVKKPKVIQRINLTISSDLAVAIKRFIQSS